MALGTTGKCRTPTKKLKINKQGIKAMIIKEWVIKRSGVSRLGASVALAVLALMAFSAVLRSQAGGQSEREGQALFEKRCTGCHNLDADHEGPRLRGVFGRPAGKVKTFPIFGRASKGTIHVGRGQTGQVADRYGVRRAG